MAFACMEMLLTFSSITERSFPFGSRLQDRVGVGLPLTMQVNSTCSPAAPGIFVFIGVDVKIVGRAVKKVFKTASSNAMYIGSR